jgi:hypothetical protein
MQSLEAALQAADGREHRRTRRFRGAGEHVAALAVEQADVDVGAAAGLVDKGLGHEAGDHLLLPGDRLDRALEIDRVVAGGQRIARCLRLISNWPGAYSATAVSAGMPWARQTSASTSVKVW